MTTVELLNADGDFYARVEIPDDPGGTRIDWIARAEPAPGDPKTHVWKRREAEARFDYWGDQVPYGIKPFRLPPVARSTSQ